MKIKRWQVYDFYRERDPSYLELTLLVKRVGPIVECEELYVAGVFSSDYKRCEIYNSRFVEERGKLNVYKTFKYLIKRHMEL